MVLKPIVYGLLMLCILMFGVILAGIAGYADSRDIDADAITLKILEARFGKPVSGDAEDK